MAGRDKGEWRMPFTNYAILIPSNYGYSRSPREFREPCWGGHWRRISFLTQALINLSSNAHRSLNACSVAVVSSVVVMSSHLITNRMRFYFFQSRCVVNVSSACQFPTRGGMQCKIVRRSLSFPRSKFENFMGYSCFMGLSLMPFGTLRIVERLIFLLRF